MSTARYFLTHVVRLEISIYVSLWRWITRRISLPGTNPVAFSHVKIVSFSIWVFIVLSAIEIPAAHLLIPWEGVRLLILILGIWGLTWMFGYLAGLHAYPHVVSDEGLRIRGGPLRQVMLPWEGIAEVRGDRITYEQDRGLHVFEEKDNRVLALILSNQTNVTVMLTQPTLVRGKRGKDETVNVIRFWADDPQALVSTSRQRHSEAVHH